MRQRTRQDWLERIERAMRFMEARLDEEIVRAADATGTGRRSGLRPLTAAPAGT